MYNVSLPWWAYALMGAGLMLFLGLLTAEREAQPRREAFAVRFALYSVDDPVYAASLRADRLLRSDRRQRRS